MKFRYEDLRNAPLIPEAIYESGFQGSPIIDDPLSKLFKLDGFNKGIGNMGGFRKSNKENTHGKSTKDVAFAAIFSTGKIEEWPNQYIREEGTFIYYGDNRTPGNHYLDTKQKGNALLEDIFKKAYGNKDERLKTPPLFVFESTGVSSNVKFLGLAVPGISNKRMDQTLILQKFDNGNGILENYQAHFTMIDIESEGINKKWLQELKKTDGDVYKFAPQEWIKFVENGLNSVEVYNTDNKKEDIILESEKEYVKKVRLTQGKFREKLLKIQPICKICGMDIKALLVASHIKPWKDSNHQERIDNFNGFLLCPSHNAAFDAGFISFDQTGKIIISKRLKDNHLALLNINKELSIVIHDNHKEYLKWHNQEVFIDNRLSKDINNSKAINYSL